MNERKEREKKNYDLKNKFEPAACTNSVPNSTVQHFSFWGWVHRFDGVLHTSYLCCLLICPA